jgi:hypothetical protein
MCLNVCHPISPPIPAAIPALRYPGSNQCKGRSSHSWLDKLLTRSVSNVGIFVGTRLQKDGK